MFTTHGSPAERPRGVELSCTVAQPPAQAVPARARADPAARTRSDLRMGTSLIAFPPLHRPVGAGSRGAHAHEGAGARPKLWRCWRRSATGLGFGAGHVLMPGNVARFDLPATGWTTCRSRGVPSAFAGSSAP